MKLFIYSLVFLCSAYLTARADEGVINGQPLSSATSEDDAYQYIDHLVQNWIDAGKSDANGNIKPDQIDELASGLKPLGTTNLIGCYKILPATSPDRSPTPKDRIKERLIAKGISLDATVDDIDVLTNTSIEQPLLLAVLLDHSEWDSNPKVITFVSTSLGTIQDIYRKSNLAPRYLLELAFRNQDTGVQSALQAMIADAIQNQSTYKNGHLYTDLIAKIALHPTPSLERSLSDLIQIDSSRVEISPADRYNGISVSDGSLNSELYGGLAGLVIAKPTLCSDPKVKAALIQMSDKLGAAGAAVMSLLVPAAASGEKTALEKIIAAYKAAPNKDPFARKYLQTIVSQPAGASLPDVLSHIESAVYDPVTCLWTVTTNQ